MLKCFTSLLHAHVPERQAGQAFIEYALVLVGVSAATQVALEVLGQRAADVLNAVGDALKSS